MNNEEIETKSKPAKIGDMVVARNNNGIPAEEYLISKEKFPTLYDINSAKEHHKDGISEGWRKYNVIPEIRDILVWTLELQDLLETVINERPISISQATAHNIITSIPFSKFFKAQKHATVLARHANENEVVITKVKANPNPVLFEFEAPWGEKMPVKENDVIVVMRSEVYRIARAEFDLTYNIL